MQMNSLSPVVRILNSPRAGEVIPVAGKWLIVGREVDCQLRLDSEFVSRHHCAFLLDEYTLRIRDLGSKNGTMVNEAPLGLHGVVLVEGDTVSIGQFTLQIELNAARISKTDDASQASPDSTTTATVNLFDGDTVIADSPQHAAASYPKSAKV